MVGQVASDQLVALVDDEESYIVRRESSGLEQVQEFLRSSDEDVRRRFEKGLKLVLNVSSSRADAKGGSDPERTS